MKSRKSLFLILLLFVAIMFISCFEDEATESKQSDNTTQQQAESKTAEVIPQTYEEFLKLAKGYENTKQWCYALGAYYDALGTDEVPENKQEAMDGYNKLCNAILSGNPGLGTYDQFEMHDEWKKILKDAEDFVSNYNPYEITIGNFIQESLDYETKTGLYSSLLSRKLGKRYKSTIGIIVDGYSKAYKKDWTDLKKNWNPFSSYNHYKYVFNIVDSTGKILYNIQDQIDFGDNDKYSLGINFKQDVMGLVDQGKLFVNPEACYLNDKKLPIYNSVFFCWNNFVDKSYENNVLVKIYLFEKNMVDIPGKGIVMAKTETTQDFYTMISGKNPTLISHGDNKPVNGVTWYDVIYFCNQLSIKAGYTPVYAVNGQKDISKWNYTPHNWTVFGTTAIKGDVTQDLNANGFRLPSLKEWVFAAYGGENYNYAGSNKASEVAWFRDNSYNVAHVVAQKKANGYGLYDMSGNVAEWVWNKGDSSNHYICGGSCKDADTWIENKKAVSGDGDDIGFRLVRNKKQ